MDPIGMKSITTFFFSHNFELSFLTIHLSSLQSRQITAIFVSLYNQVIQFHVPSSAMAQTDDKHEKKRSL